MNGRTLATAIQDFRPHIKVLYMSGYTDNVIMHQGVLDPGTSFLQKGFTPSRLARKVREVLDPRQ
jgi:DNA-binding NtrC family response regulator